MVRMPAFGLTGPWRDRPGFAQTMEQITGLAWLTGFADDQPRIQRGPCDPNGGMHAAFARAGRRSSGATVPVSGCLVEAPMFEAALNVAAEPVLEWTAYGNRVARDGNRSPRGRTAGRSTPAPAPSSGSRCRSTTDEQWQRLVRRARPPRLGRRPRSSPTLAGRRRAPRRLDAAIGAWAAPLDLDKAVDALVAAGVPAAPATDPRRAQRPSAAVARGYYETVDHPVVGTQPVAGLPFRVDRRRPLDPPARADARPAQRRDPRRPARLHRRRARSPRSSRRYRHLARRALRTERGSTHGD